MIEVIICDKELYSPADIAPKTLGSAGLDLKLARDAKSAHQIAAEGGAWPYQDLVPTGLKVRVPTNMVGLIVPRSSAGHKHGFRIGNTIGIIDSDYRGEIMMSIGGGDYGLLKRGATVAQLIMVPYSSFYGATIVDQFSDETERGEGGFGSTDKQKCDHCGGDGWEPGHAYDKDWPCGKCDGLGRGSTDNLLVQDFCPNKGNCQDGGCPIHNVTHDDNTKAVLTASCAWAHSTEPLPEQKLGVLQEFDHETAQLQYEQYALSTKNGGF